MDYNQNQNNLFESYQEYAKKDKTYKITFFKVFLLVLSIVHYIFGYPYLKGIMRTNLINSEYFSDSTIEYIMKGYYVCSFIFIAIALWNIAKTRYTLKRLYIIALVGCLAFLGYKYYMANHFVNTEVPYTFIVDSKTIIENAKTQWRFEAKGFNRSITFAKRYGVECTKHLTEAIPDGTNYYITINDKGKVTEYYVSNDKYQYEFKGDYLTDLKDIDRNATAIKDTNKVIIPECPKVKDILN